MAISYPISLDAFNNPAGTTLLADPSYLHNQEHGDANDAIEALEAKMGLGAGTPKVDLALIGSGNGTAVWGSVWNNATLGSPTVTGGTLNNIYIASGTSVIGGKTLYTTVGTANADYITDGTADDVQIQAAIDAVAAAGGGVVFLQAGTYQLSNNTTSPAFIQSDTGSPYCGVILKDKVVLQGAGMGKSVLTYSAFVGTALGQNMNPIVNSAAGQSFQGVMDLSILNPSFSVTSGPYARSIHVKGVTNFLMKNLYLFQGGWAVFANTYSWGTTTKFLTTDTHEILIDNVTSDTYKDSCMLFNLRNAVVRNSNFLTSYDDSILIGQSGQDILIQGCHFEGDSTGVGAATGMIYLDNDSSLTSDQEAIKNVSIANNSIKNFNMTSGDSSGIALFNCTNVKITDNYIDKMKLRGIYNRSNGTIQDILIQGNTIRNCGSIGISFPLTVTGASLYGVNISNNTIYNNNVYGIYMETATQTGTANGAIIANNEIYDNQGTPTQTTGISVHGGVKNFSNLFLNMNNIHNTGTAYDLVGGTLLGLSNLFVTGGGLSYTGTAATTTPLANA